MQDYPFKNYQQKTIHQSTFEIKLWEFSFDRTHTWLYDELKQNWLNYTDSKTNQLKKERNWT